MTNVAVVQTGSVMFDTPQTLARMESWCEQARAEQVELLVFPEAFIGGYPKGLDFGARVGSRSSAGRDEYLRYARAAIEVPGPETARIGKLAAALGGHIVVGVIERAGNTLYCTALYFDPAGQLVGRHRKLVPTGSERLIWGQGDGSTLGVVDSPVGRFGAVICWENYMPMLRTAMYAQGIQIWCAPTVDERDMWQVSMRHIAYEGRCFVLSACQYLTRADCPPDYGQALGAQLPDTLIRGGSVIIAPLGQVLAGPVYDREALLCAQIDLNDTIRGKYDLDVVGHYARNDVFSLSVDTRAHASVRATSDGPC